MKLSLNNNWDRFYKKAMMKIITNIFMILLAVLFLFPTLWMIAASTKPDSIIFSEMGTLASFIPNVKNISDIFNNYVSLFTEYKIYRFMINSILYSGVIVAGSIFLNSLAGYALAKYNFPGKKLIFGLIIGLIVVPVETTIIPLYTIVHELGFTGSVFAVIFPPLISAFNIFLFRQFFIGIPKELEEAAVIDGASKLQIYYKIILPISKPIVATVATFTFIGAWNDYIWPIMVLPAPTGDKWPLYPIQAALNTIQQQPTITTGEVMASLTLTTIPLIVVYILAQKYIVEGLGHTGLK